MLNEKLTHLSVDAFMVCCLYRLQKDAPLLQYPYTLSWTADIARVNMTWAMGNIGAITLLSRWYALNQDVDLQSISAFFIHSGYRQLGFVSRLHRDSRVLNVY
jgi:hypothetical protein